MATGSKSGRQGSPQGQTIPHTRIDDETHLQEYYDIGRKLGEGTFGIVKEVVHKDTGETWACKAVNKEKAGNPQIRLLEREVAILKRVHHEHIIKLKEVFETSKKMFLIMEYCAGGELADALKERGTFSEDQAKTIVQRLAKSISYLHKNDMVHRDLKLENILLSTNPEDKVDDLYIKVTDFGLSVVKSGVGIENLLMDFCGTPMYMAPEIIDNKTYGEKCDVWAMGVICYTLICGQAPFTARDEDTLYDLVKNHDIKKHMSKDSCWKNKSDKVKDLIAKMLTIDPAHRYTSHEVLDHPWITGAGMETLRQGNVLEMMRKWHTENQFNDLPIDEDDDENQVHSTNTAVVNGEARLSQPPSRDGSASSGGGGQRKLKDQRHSVPTGSRKTVSQIKKARSPNPGVVSPIASKNSNGHGAHRTSNGGGVGSKPSGSRLASTSRTPTTANGGLSRVTSDSNLRTMSRVTSDSNLKQHTGRRK